MPHYGIAERRIRQGQTQAFVDATRRVGEHLAATGWGQSAFSLYLAEDDPESALLVGSWSDPAEFERAYDAIPKELIAAVDAAVDRELGRVWRWYSPVRELMTFGARPGFVAATLWSVEPTMLDEFRTWLSELQDRASRLPGVSATRVLVARDDPSEHLYLGEYRDRSLVQQVTQLTREPPPPTPFRDRRRFLGTVGYVWDKPAPQRPNEPRF